MGKQYISTLSVSNDSRLDLYSVKVCKHYTATACGDGNVKLWFNGIQEGDSADKDSRQIFVHSSGVHHIDIIEDVIDGVQITLLAAISFSGELFIYSIRKESSEVTVGTSVVNPIKIEYAEGAKRLRGLWAVKLFPEEGVDTFLGLAVTQVDGSASVYTLMLPPNVTELEDVGLTLVKRHSFQESSGPANHAFPTCLDVKGNNGNLAVGFQNGTVFVYSIQSGQLKYTLYGHGENNSSCVRSVKISPDESLIAVARDSGTAGSIFLYNFESGEAIGNLSILGHSAVVYGNQSDSSSIHLNAHTGWVLGLDWDETGKFIVSGGYDGKIRIWNCVDREREATINISKSDLETSSEDTNDIAAVTDVCFHPQGVRPFLNGTGGGIVAVALDGGIRWYREAGKL